MILTSSSARRSPIRGSVHPRAPGILAAFALLVACLSSFGCRSSAAASRDESAAAPASKKVGVLLVNHGSRSDRWRSALLALEERVREPILRGGAVGTVTTAFMEYTEPSIATRLRELDRDGYTDVVLVPVLLTVSPHSFEDIPTIVGQKEDPKSLEMLKIEHIERYAPRARVHRTPLLDFSDILQGNVVRRVRAMSKNPSEEGLVLIAYGDETYEKQWDELLDGVAGRVREEVGVSAHAHGWCGHVAHYDPAKTTAAIEQVLAEKRRALVIPVLVAEDEMFQVKIIGDGIANVARADERVAYKPDAILPDPGVDEWVVQAVHDEVARIAAGSSDVAVD